jgi:hypothetical protein
VGRALNENLFLLSSSPIIISLSLAVKRLNGSVGISLCSVLIERPVGEGVLSIGQLLIMNDHQYLFFVTHIDIFLRNLKEKS